MLNIMLNMFLHFYVYILSISLLLGLVELRALGRGGRRLDQIYSCGGGPALSYSILESMRVCGREVARLDRCSSYSTF